MRHSETTDAGMDPSEYHHFVHRCAEPTPCERQFTNWRLIAFALAALILACVVGVARTA